jgi:hypothetical protein
VRRPFAGAYMRVRVFNGEPRKPHSGTAASMSQMRVCRKQAAGGTGGVSRQAKALRHRGRPAVAGRQQA